METRRVWNVLLFQFALRFDDQTHFRTGRDQNDFRLSVRRLSQDVSPAFQAIGGGVAATVQGRHILAGQDQRDGTVRGLKRHSPGVRSFVGVAGPDHDQAWNGAQVGDLLHRLVSGSVFAQGNAVMGEHVDDPLLHHGRQPHGRAHVIGEDQEGRSVWDDAAVYGHAVQNRAHPVLANAEVQVATGVTPAAAARTLRVARGSIGRFEIARAFQRRVRRGIQIRRTAHQRRKFGCNRVHHLSGGHAGLHPLRVSRKNGNVRVPTGGQFAAHPLFKFPGQVRMYGRVASEVIAPFRLRLLTAWHGLAKMRERFRRDIEEGLDRPTQVLLRQLHLFHAQRRTVRFKRVLLVRGTEAQVGADQNQRRPPRFVRAARRARSIASTSLPSSTDCVCQPYASKRFAWSSLQEMFVPAESVTWLLSKR